MSVVLVRIDDRLVHGQVVEGWLKALRVNHVVVVSDAVAADETQKALYLLAVPQGVQLSCLTVAQAAKAWQKDAWGREKVLLLTASPQEVLALAEQGVAVTSVNVGGLHFREGRVPVLRAISLDDRDVAALRVLAARGILLEARPLPLDEPVDLVAYLERWQQEKDLLGDQPR